MTNSRNFFSKEQDREIVKAIHEAELHTSGEIRVHIEGRSKKDPLIRAAEVFKKLGMSKTELHNGVLFYLAIKDRRFAILGDSGIHEKVGEDFWKQISEDMATNFKAGNFSRGLSDGILSAGEKLREFFPYQSDDINELPDEVSYGD